MRTITVTFPMPPDVVNARLHWAAKLRAHNEWKTRALVGDRELRGRHAPMQRVRVTAVMYVGSSPMDPDNCTSRLKWAIDFLRERGRIVNDDPAHLTLTGIPEQRKEFPRRVVLTLEEVA